MLYAQENTQQQYNTHAERLRNAIIKYVFLNSYINLRGCILSVAVVYHCSHDLMCHLSAAGQGRQEGGREGGSEGIAASLIRALGVSCLGLRLRDGEVGITDWQTESDVRLIFN